VVCSLDGRMLASGSGDTTIKTWNTVAGICSQSVTINEHSVLSITFLPDSYMVVWLASYLEAQLLTFVILVYLNALGGHNDQIPIIAFANGGRLFEFGSNDCTIKIWDMATGACFQIL
ncbi:hypothetical protein M426DRAFT_47272, partial [Hypoxylon sp. CI-4A]